MTCTPQALVSAAICYTKLGKHDLEAADIYLLCRWAAAPPPGCTQQGPAWMGTPSITFVGDTLNIFSPLNPIPPPFNPTYAILAWGTSPGVYSTQLTVPVANFPNPFALLPPPLSSHFLAGTTYYFIVRSFDDAGHCSDLSAEKSHFFPGIPLESTPVWLPTTEQVTWIDTNGTFTGDYPTFAASVSVASLTSMVFGATGNLTSLTNLGTAASLVTLDVNTNALTALDCTGLAALTTLDCHGNSSLTTLTLTGCTSLSVLDCNTCDITGVLNVSPAAASLTNLQTYDNVNLTGVTLTGCSSLNYWDTGNTAITAVNLTDCTSLANLAIEQNSLTTLDVSPCLPLTDLSAWGNPSLSSVTITGLVSLTGLDVHSCDITGTLDASPCPSLLSLICYSNPNLTALTLTGLTSLLGLGCDGCNITGTLDVSPSAASLNTLDCYSNANLTGINLTGCSSLTALDCHSCSMNQAAVDSVLCTTDVNGAINGTLNITSNTAPSAAGLVCSGNLDPGKGWTVTHD